jgi:hypothetical protein
VCNLSSSQAYTEPVKRIFPVSSDFFGRLVLVTT